MKRGKIGSYEAEKPRYERRFASLVFWGKKLLQIGKKSDITGTTGMAILRGIVSGERDGKVLARHRDPHCKKSEEEIIKSLEGHYQEQHLFTLKQELEFYDCFTQKIKETDGYIETLYKEIGSQVNLEEKPLKAAPRKKKYQKIVLILI